MANKARCNRALQQVFRGNGIILANIIAPLGRLRAPTAVACPNYTSNYLDGAAMSDSRTNDEELIKQLVDGEQSALAKLFELNRYRLQRMIAVRMDQRLKGRVDEADILQEAFMILSKKIDSYDTNMSPYVWMRLTVLDQLIAEHRKHIRAGKRDARREVSISQKVGDESSTELAATLELSLIHI